MANLTGVDFRGSVLYRINPVQDRYIILTADLHWRPLYTVSRFGVSRIALAKSSLIVYYHIPCLGINGSPFNSTGFKGSSVKRIR